MLGPQLLHNDMWVLTPLCPQCREPVLTCPLQADVSGRRAERGYRCWTVGRDGDRGKHLLSPSWASGTVLRAVSLSLYSVLTTNQKWGLLLPHFTEKTDGCSGSRRLIRL